MQIKNDLEIVIITYNRLPFFEKTMKQLFSENSPIKNCSITILDNHSNDGTSKLCEKYASEYKNVKHVRHNINIGGNANIIRAFEIATKKYLWILCDDDSYDWNNWKYIQKGLDENYDIVLTTNQPRPVHKGLHRSLFELTFVPGGIYKTEYFSTEIMQMAAANVINFFPHMAFACYYVNNKRKIFAPKKRVVNVRVSYSPHEHIMRDCKERPFHRISKMDFLTAYINTYKMLKDKKLRYKCNEYLIPERTFVFCIGHFLSLNHLCMENFSDVFSGLNTKQRLIYLREILKYLFKTEKIIKFYVGEHGHYVKLFGRIKMKVWPDRIIKFYRGEKGYYLNLLGTFKTKIWPCKNICDLGEREADKLLSQPYSQLRNQERKPLADKLPLKLPFSIYLEPTNKCTFRCKACPLSFDDYRDIVGYSGDMDFELYKKIILDIKKLGRLVSLKFYMEGEPLLNKNLIKMMQFAREHDVAERFELTTNASLLSEEIIKDLIGIKLNYLRISIYSVIQQRHEYVTDSKIDIQKIYNNVKSAREIRDNSGSQYPFIYVKMLDTFDEKENQMFKELYSPIADEIMIEKPMNWNDYENRDLLKAYYGDKKPQEEKIFPNYKEVCPFPFYSCVINCDGTVTICCVDWNKKTMIGDLKKNSFDEIWNGKSANDFRKMHLRREKHKNPSCKNCRFLYTSVDNLDDFTLEEFSEKYEKIEIKN